MRVYRRETPVANLSVVVGAHYVDDVTNERHYLDTAVIHLDYDPDPATSDRHDIMLLRVQTLIQFDFNVQPICVDDSITFPPYTQCFVTGWGAVQYPSSKYVHVGAYRKPSGVP